MKTEPYFHVYQDAKNEWRWTLYAENYKKIADSCEGYVSDAGCMHGISLVKAFAPKATISKGSGGILGDILGAALHRK